MQPYIMLFMYPFWTGNEQMCYYRPGARFNKEVQPTLSLNLNSELTYSEMGNSRVFGFRTAELC